MKEAKEEDDKDLPSSETPTRSPASHRSFETEGGEVTPAENVSTSPRSDITSVFQSHERHPQASAAAGHESVAVSVEDDGQSAEQDNNRQEVLIGSEENHQLPSSVAREDIITCERCGQDVSVWEMPEHNDYHFALDLQNSLSSSAPSTSSSSSSTASPLGVAGHSARGKTKSRLQSGPQSKRHRSQGGGHGTLDAFFKKNQ